jgi:hypothetical protein
MHVTVCCDVDGVKLLGFFAKGGFMMWQMCLMELLSCHALQVTYLVVSKSHGTRLFPVSEGDALRGNVMPGTVVDTQVVAPLKYEFFINPHAGIQVGNTSLPLLRQLWRQQ